MDGGLTSGDIWKKILKRKEEFRIAKISSTKRERYSAGTLRPVLPSIVNRKGLLPTEHWSWDKKMIWGSDEGIIYRRAPTEAELAAIE
jgi:hypothetical protein